MSMCNLYDAIPRPCRLTALALVLAMAGGCGAGNTSPVKGKVVFKDGSPLSGGLVLFKPLDEKLQVSARGDIREDGTFILGTYKDDDGAVPGKYSVAITPPPRQKVREKPVSPPTVHRRFTSHETSGLEFDVTRKKNDFTIVIDKP
jgi:hypothetical protein